MTEPQRETQQEPRTSYRTAFILCILLGWLGGHRYYLRLWGTAVLYTFSLGLFGIGILVDLLTLPLLVRERRDIEAGIPLPPVQAAWAEEEQASWWNWFQLILRYAILVLAPPITVILAISFGQYLAVALVFLLLGFSLFVGSIGRGLYGLEDMKEVAERFPLLELAVKAMGITSRIEQHYSEHRAGSVFYYLLYPVLGPLAMTFSPRARSEFRQYLSLFSIMVFGVVVHNVWNYQKIFLWDAGSDPLFGLIVCLILAVAGIVLFFGCVVPMVSSSFYLSKTGRSLSLRTTAAVALVICGWAVLWSTSGDSVPVRGTLTILRKFNSGDFKKEFSRASKLFLAGEMHRIRFDNGARDLTKPNGVKVVVDEKLTKLYRNLVADMIRDEEANALSVVSVHPGGGHRGVESDSPGIVPWLAIRMDPDPLRMRGALGGVVLLYVAAPDGRVLSRWDTLYNPQVPREFQFQACFRRHGSESAQDRIATALETSAAPNQLTAFLLADDLGYVPILGPLEAGLASPGTTWQELRLALDRVFDQKPKLAPPDRVSDYRTFHDNTGTKQVKARIVAVEGDMVHLEREDGDKVVVPINRLGTMEQFRVEEWKKEKGM